MVYVIIEKHCFYNFRENMADPVPRETTLANYIPKSRTIPYTSMFFFWWSLGLEGADCFIKFQDSLFLFV